MFDVPRRGREPATTVRAGVNIAGLSFCPDARPAHLLVCRSRPARALPLGTTSHHEVEVPGAAGPGGKTERFEELPTAPPPFRVGVENQRPLTSPGPVRRLELLLGGRRTLLSAHVE